MDFVLSVGVRFRVLRDKDAGAEEGACTSSMGLWRVAAVLQLAAIHCQCGRGHGLKE